MNKNKKWLLAVGVAAMITASGIAMAAITPGQQDAAAGKKYTAIDHRDGKGKAMKASFNELLTLLNIDGQTLKSEIKAGKTLGTIAGEHGVSEQVLKEFLVGHINQHLEAGIKSGRITAEQAEKMKANMDERVSTMMNSNGFMNRGHGHKAGHGYFQDAKLLALLKVDAETLRNELKADKSLVTIAKEHGVSEQTLKGFMVAQMTERIEKGIEAGRIPAEKAEKMKVNIDERVSNMINSNGFKRNGHGPKAGHKSFGGEKLLGLLKMDAETFRSERKADKSLVIIAKEHGVSEQTLKQFIIAQMTEHIEKGVESGRISTDKAEKMKANMDERVTKMINGTGMMRHGHGFGQQKKVDF